MMKKILSVLCAATIGLGSLALAAPAGADPIPGQGGPLPDRFRIPHASGGGGGYYRPGGWDGRHGDWHRRHGDRDGGYRHHHRGFYHHGGSGWYNGHRGYRHYHHGYRYYNGWWFPGAAFLGGAIIGSTIARPAYGGSAHVRWCYDHYRSYRASDNTFQPYHGPRRQCVSPYD